MTKADPFGRETRFGRFAPIVLPVLAILAARAATHTEWAATNTMLAALLFCWVVAWIAFALSVWGVMAK